MIAAPAVLALSCAPVADEAQPGDEKEKSIIVPVGRMEVATFTKRPSRPSGPQPTSHTASASGIVTAVQGCLALRSGDVVQLLVFSEDSVAEAGGALLVDGQAVREGWQITVTGSRTGGPAAGDLKIPAEAHPRPAPAGSRRRR
jgi:hypothetical protein